MHTDRPTHSDAMWYVLHVRCITRVGARSAFDSVGSIGGDASSYRSPSARRMPLVPVVGEWSIVMWGSFAERNGLPSRSDPAR